MKSSSKGLVGLLAALSISATVLSGCGSSDSSAGSTDSQTVSPEKGDGAADSTDKPATSFRDGVYTSAEVKFEVTRFKVIRVGQKGNEYGKKPVIAFWYKTTNLSGEKTDSLAFISHFNAFQDNDPNVENQLEVGMLPDDRFLESQMENIKKGGTVESAVAYELDDLKTPVVLVASDNIDETVGKMTYKLG